MKTFERMEFEKRIKESILRAKALSDDDLSNEISILMDEAYKRFGEDYRSGLGLDLDHAKRTLYPEDHIKRFDID